MEEFYLVIISSCVTNIRFVEIKMAEFFKAMPVFNPSITNTTTVSSYAFESDKVFMNTLFKLIVQLQNERLAEQAGLPIWLNFACKLG